MHNIENCDKTRTSLYLFIFLPRTSPQNFIVLHDKIRGINTVFHTAETAKLFTE